MPLSPKRFWVWLMEPIPGFPDALRPRQVVFIFATLLGSLLALDLLTMWLVGIFK